MEVRLYVKQQNRSETVWFEVVEVFMDKDIYSLVELARGIARAPREFKSMPAYFPKFWIHEFFLDHQGCDWSGP